jgi:hypothetical protein
MAGKEAKLERSLSQYAKSIGVITLKLEGGTRGKPDRLYLYNSKVLFIEFKSPSGKPSSLQLIWQRKLRLQGFRCLISSDEAEIKAAIDDLVNNERHIFYT